MKNILPLAALLLGIFFTSQSMAYDNCTIESNRCSFAIFPHSNFKQLLITYKSILEDLSLILDTKVKLVSSRTMADFATKIDRKAFDIALIGPGQFLRHARDAGYIPLARREGQLEMALFVRADSDIQSYADLKGRKMGFMLANTTSWFSANILLQKYGVSKTDIQLVTQGSQQSCAHAIAIHQVEACVFAASNLNIIKEQNVNIKFRQIGDTLSIMNPVYAVHPSMPEDVMAELKDYLISREGYTATDFADFNEFRHQIKMLR